MDPDRDLCKAVLINNTAKKLQNIVGNKKNWFNNYPVILNKGVIRTYYLMGEVKKHFNLKIEKKMIERIMLKMSIPKLLLPIPDPEQSPELLKAFQIGYKVLEAYEVWDFNEKQSCKILI